jgi:uncharacterized membrane protein
MTGLAILLPIIFTVMIISFFINMLTTPFLEPTKALIGQLNFFQKPFLVFNEATLVTMSSRMVILSFLIAFTILIGLFGKLFLIDYFFRLGDYFFHKLPFVNKIYKACQDVVHSLFSSSSKSFSQVVFVPYPNSRNLSIGLVTGEPLKVGKTDQETKDLISVFVPGTPNPSVGFLLMFKKEQLIFVDMKVDEAMKFVVSCGTVVPDFSVIQPPMNLSRYSNGLDSSSFPLRTRI